MVKELIQSLDNGFRLFDWYHLSWLLLTVFVILVMHQIYRQADLKKRRKIRIIWALVILMLEGIKNLVLVGQGAFWYGSLPLHLCGLGIFIVLAHALIKGHRMDILLYCLTMPGAFMSLLTPDWTDVSAFNYLHVHSFLFHLILFAYPVTMLATKELQLSIRKIGCFLFYASVSHCILVAEGCSTPAGSARQVRPHTKRSVGGGSPLAPRKASSP
ncbi:MAG: YwaF family protein [Lysinibacillus sp.]